MPAAVSLMVVAVITALLWYLKLTIVSPHDPVFFYVLPIIVIAMVYGSGPALLGACAAFGCADYFLYDPLYSFDICSRQEFGDLAYFSLLTGIGVKCAGALFHPSAKVSAAKSWRLLGQNADAN
jgi:K+-sensing histidine kinase KdpD